MGLRITKSVAAKTTRFDLALTPDGLGQVNVRVQIDNAGQVTAALSFDNPHAAAEARAHAGDLQQALQQAGFNVSQNSLSFDVGGQGASLAQQHQGQGQAFVPSSVQASGGDDADTPALSSALAAYAAHTPFAKNSSNASAGIGRAMKNP